MCSLSSQSRSTFFGILLFSNIFLISIMNNSQQDITVFAQNYQSNAGTQPNSRSQHLIEITAGKIQNFSFRIDLSNIGLGTLNSQQTITDIAVFISSQSSSVKIVGPTTWSLPSINSNSSKLITTKVYASPTIIGNPVFFTVNLQYIKNGQELKTGSFDLGAVVTGDINLEANNLAIRYLGDTPNLVGNILNKGNTGALFTIVQILSVNPPLGTGAEGIANLGGSSQFLGTILPNNPTPFTIPLLMPQKPESNLPNVTGSSSNYLPSKGFGNASGSSVNTVKSTSTNLSVKFKITYSDELTNNHELRVNGSIPSELADFDSGSADGINDNSQNNNGPSNVLSTGSQYILNNGFVDAYWAENVLSNNSSASETSNSLSSMTQLMQNQREVGPGEGPAILAIVLTNTAFSDITGITGYLSLPTGFSSALSSSSSSFSKLSNASTSSIGQSVAASQNVASNERVNPTNPAIASISDVVKAGQSYTLFFKVNVLRTASVGPHTAFLRIYYFKNPDPEIGTYRIQTIAIPFTLAGKVVLDTTPMTSDLIPGQVNHVKIQLKNKGTADANNVLVTLNNAGNSIITTTPSQASSGTNLSSSNLNGQLKASSLGSRVFNLGTIAAGSSAEIDAAILPSFSSGESLQNLNLDLSYTDATGDTRTSEEEIGFRILPNPPEAGLAVNPNVMPQTQIPSVPNPNNNQTTNAITNGNSGNSGLTVLPSKTDSYSDVRSISMNIHSTGSPGTNSSYINYDENGKHIDKGTITNLSKYAYKTIPVSNVLSNNIRNDQKNITNANSMGLAGNQLNSGNLTGNNNYDKSITVVAGKVSDLNFTITNNNNYPISDAVVSLASQSNSISIAGPSKWNLQRLEPDARQFFPTSVFASPSLIGNPATFQVGIQYILNGRARNDTFTMGAKVIGEISVDVSNLAISNIAGTPNLVGNLLNKGNTIALFTTIELLSNNKTNNVDFSQISKSHAPFTNQTMKSSNKSPFRSSDHGTALSLVPASFLPSYLGDLDANSPLPFSIPLIMQNNSTPGKYPVSLKVTYSDDLRVSHELTINDSVDVVSRRQRQDSNSGGEQGIIGLLAGKRYSLQLGSLLIPIPILVIILAIFLSVLIVLKRRRTRTNAAKLYATSKSKEGTFFLDEKENKNDGTIYRETSTMKENQSKVVGDQASKASSEGDKGEAGSYPAGREDNYK